MSGKRIFKAASVGAVGLVIGIMAGSGAYAADQRSSSGNSRPLMPGNQPAGTGLKQTTPGASTAPASKQKPVTPQQAPATHVPAPSSGGSASGPLKGQGTVQGSKGAPQLNGATLPGGTAGSRGAKDSIGGH